jgi:N-carbamoylputrescine amidase
MEAVSRYEETRRGWPFLRGRRIDAYGDLTRRFIDASITDKETE